MIAFEIPGEPVGKGRPRTLARKGKGGKTYMAHITPEKTVNYEALVATMGRLAMAGRPPLQGPLEMLVTALFTIPASASKKERERMAGGAWVTKKPDASNVLKAIEDGLNGIAYGDDAQLAHVTLVRRYGLRPCVLVTIRQLPV